jgi:hypothetical protein
MVARMRMHALAVIAALAAACSSSPSHPDQPGGADAGVDASPAADAPTTADAPTCQADLQNDPQNCGRCGRSCGGATCSRGLCDPLLVLDAQEEPYGPTQNQLVTFVDHGAVYEWEYTTTLANHYVVQRAPTTPASPPSMGVVIQDVPSQPSIDAAAFDPTYVYEAIEGTAAGAKGQVARKRLDRADGTGAGARMFSLPADLKWDNLAIAADAIYLTGTTTLNGPDHPEPDTTTIYRMALADVTADGNALPTALPQLAGRNQSITDLTVVGGHLFWLEYDLASSDYLVFTAPVGGGAPVQLDDASTSDSSFTTDGTYVYWTEANALGNLMRCPLANLDAQHVAPVAAIESAREGIVASGPYVYVMAFPDPRPVYRVTTATGAMEELGDIEIPPSEKGTRVIGVDAGFVYVTTTDAKVWRIPNAP